MTPCWSQENIINAAGESSKRIRDQSGLILLHLDVNKSVADLRRGHEGYPPVGPNSFNFMQFLGKFGKIVCWHPPGELVPSPRGNPGSATVKD